MGTMNGIEEKLQSTDDRMVLLTGPRGSPEPNAPSSLTRLADRVSELLARPELIARKKEVVVAGGWTYSKDAMDVLEARFGDMDFESAVETDSDEPMRSGDLTRARSQSSAAQKTTPRKHELEWAVALCLIKSILEKIEVDYIRWETDLPFSKEIWSVVPNNIQKLSLNLFVPDAEDLDVHDPHPEYFTRDDLMQLVNFRHLRTLRVYNMTDSFQSILWETVWKNPNLTTLEMGMRDRPITRDNENSGRPMTVMDRGWEYKSGCAGSEKYRGREGSGMLHHLYGLGEYLDTVAISKARNRAMYSIGDVKNTSLKTLRLVNFVVDDTSFEKYLDGLTKIVFTQCVDAGFALPKNLQGKVRIFVRPDGYAEAKV